MLRRLRFEKQTVTWVIRVAAVVADHRLAAGLALCPGIARLINLDQLQHAVAAFEFFKIIQVTYIASGSNLSSA